MSILSFFRSRVSLAFIALGLALVLAAACNGDGGRPESFRSVHVDHQAICRGLPRFTAGLCSRVALRCAV